MGAVERSTPRVRFAPSPTGPLHIGGLRTALYNYLYARRHKGAFILRIEDTDQARLVKGAEEYIKDSLTWLGLSPDEGPSKGGEYGPYRQSERQTRYRQAVQTLLAKGAAYYAFDSNEELAAMRASLQQSGAAHQHYNALTRQDMRNSLTLPEAETKALLGRGEPHVVRLKIDPQRSLQCHDSVRGAVRAHGSTLEDKILLKSDGWPTYHLANVVDDHAMNITHVIRGEEWLPSLPYHILLYEAFGWTPPRFAHLPLLLNQSGKGKLSKRQALKHDYPIFPLQWRTDEGRIEGFRERGFLQEALLNYLALLGWTHPEQKEILTLEELTKTFSMEAVASAGAQYSLDKAHWLNAQHMRKMPPEELAERLKNYAPTACKKYTDKPLKGAVALLQARADTLKSLLEQAQGILDSPDLRIPPPPYPSKAPASLILRWLEAYQTKLHQLGQKEWDAATARALLSGCKPDDGLPFNAILPHLRYSLTGQRSGPDIFAVIALLGSKATSLRIANALHAYLSK